MQNVSSSHRTLTLPLHSHISSLELPPNSLIMTSIIRVRLRPSCAASARRGRHRPRAPRSAWTALTDAAPAESGTSPVKSKYFSCNTVPVGLGYRGTTRQESFEMYPRYIYHSCELVEFILDAGKVLEFAVSAISFRYFPTLPSGWIKPSPKLTFMVSKDPVIIL